MTTWSKTFAQMGVELCNECGEDTSFTSCNGKFVNRVPADDGWLCPDCLNEIENEFEKENDHQQLEEIYEALVGADGMERYTHAELIEYIHQLKTIEENDNE